ncbi:mammalian cell entry protein [Mycobacterium arosiense ATCC BAA-1401 = DSM 45069]|uniref:Mammalian cell entry protein n=2 Tax=Mycobacterium arosiense TaxID=425468 RepID=A0A1W9ZBW7_MYCAI|nr:mammalian cell entry protein [Mycobacterium arosiense ATCC BAA-1401 = DSM 45069]
MFVASLGIRVGAPAKRTSLAMDVPDVNNITVDSNVLLRGVPVGKVTAVDATVSSATIHFYIEDQYPVPVDSDVRLDNLSALGETYIELEPRSTVGPLLRDGQRIAAEKIKQPPSISELATSVGRVLKQLDPQQLSRVIGEADTGLPDPGAVAPNLARSSMLLRNVTADFKGQGRALLDNFQSLLQNAEFVGPALAEAAPPIRDLAPPLRVIWNDALATVGLTLRPEGVADFSAFITRIQKFLDDRGADLRILGEATSENVKLIASSLRNFDTSQILANLLATLPEDGVVELHVAVPQK